MNKKIQVKPLSEDEIESIESQPLSFDELTETIKDLKKSIHAKQQIVCKLQYQRELMQRKSIAEAIERYDKEVEQDKKDRVQDGDEEANTEKNVVENFEDENWVPYSKRKPADRTCIRCGSIVQFHKETDEFEFHAGNYLCKLCGDVFFNWGNKHEYEGFRGAMADAIIYDTELISAENERKLIRIIHKTLDTINPDEVIE